MTQYPIGDPRRAAQERMQGSLRQPQITRMNRKISRSNSVGGGMVAGIGCLAVTLYAAWIALIVVLIIAAIKYLNRH